MDNNERLVATEQRSKSNTHRIEKLEEENKVLYKLATSMEVMAVQTENIANTVEKLDDRMEIIEQKPAMRWEQTVSAIIIAIIGIVAGMIFGGAL